MSVTENEATDNIEGDLRGKLTILEFRSKTMCDFFPRIRYLLY